MGTSDRAMGRVVKTLEELGIPYAICGAMAVNAHGLRRATQDVDVLLRPEGLARFKEQALGRGFVEKFPGSRGVNDGETKEYVALATLIEMKIASAMTAKDRPRDFDDVIRLIRGNDLGELYGDSLHPLVRDKYRELWGYAQLPPAQPE